MKIEDIEKGLVARGFDPDDFLIQHRYKSAFKEAIILTDNNSDFGKLELLIKLKVYVVSGEGNNEAAALAESLGFRSITQVINELFTPDTVKYFDKSYIHEGYLQIVLYNNRVSNLSLRLDTKRLTISSYLETVWSFKEQMIAIMKELDQKGWTLDNNAGFKISDWKDFAAGKETIEQEIKTYVMNNYAAKAGPNLRCVITKDQILMYPDKHQRGEYVDINLESSANCISATYYAKPEVYKMIDDIAAKWNIKTGPETASEKISSTFGKIVKQHNYNVYVHSDNAKVNRFTFELLSPRVTGLSAYITPHLREIEFYSNLNEWISAEPEGVKEMLKELDILDYELKDGYLSTEDITLWLDL